MAVEPIFPAAGANCAFSDDEKRDNMVIRVLKNWVYEGL
jgi:hypothetical protein